MAGNYTCVLANLSIDDLEKACSIAGEIVDQSENVFSAKVSAGTSELSGRSSWFIDLAINSKNVTQAMKYLEPWILQLGRLGVSDLEIQLLTDPNFGLAGRISELVGNALYLCESDTCCSSGAIWFEAGKPVKLEVYGAGGSELYVSGTSENITVTSIPVEKFEFWQCSAKAFCQFVGIPEQHDIDEVLDNYVPFTAPVCRECIIVYGKQRKKIIEVVEASQKNKKMTQVVVIPTKKKESWLSRLFGRNK